jgi:HK97 family phage major capsid protein
VVSTTTTNAAILTPEEIHAFVVLPLQQQSVAMQVGDVVQINSHVLRVPRVTQDVSASFVPEGGEIPATDAAVDQIEITPAKLAALSVITSELAADSSPSALKLVGDSIVRDVSRKLDAAFFATSTPNGPAGLGSITPTAADAGDSWTNLDAFEYARSVAEQHNTVVTSFVGNPATVLKISTLKEGTASNKGLLQPDSSKPTGRMVAGVQLLTSPAVPSDVIWAIPQDRVVIALRQGAEVKTDASVFFTSDKLAIRTTLRVSWAVTDPLALTKIAITP